MIKDVDEIRSRCQKALRGTEVQRAIVFGSWARGTQDSRSDIDIIVVEETDRRFFERYRDLGGLYDALHENAIDLLVYTPGEFESIADRPFIRKALSEGVVVYER